MAKVELESVRKVYPGGHVAVAGASFSCADGELVVLVGPSGCGKSTLLRMIAGLESITSGKLSIGGRVVNDVAPKDRDIAMVFQSYALYPHMTVAANLSFGLELRGLPRAEIGSRVREAATLLGLDTLLDRRPRQLSGGQRQRVALGRALVRQPAAFLLDEPLSNLDAKLRLATRTELSRLHRRLGTTMLYVTHDQIEAMTLGQRIVVMNGGEIQQIDSPMAIYDRPASTFVATFLGSPAMNLFRGTLARDGAFALRAPGLTLALDDERSPATVSLAPYEGTEIVAGIRPEHLEVANRPVGDRAQVAATVEVLEPVGNEIFVTARAGTTELTARVPPQSLPAPGEPIAFRYDVRHLRFFRASDGTRID
jgi:multiple sugar transport system ATP-binding protein